MSQEIPYRTVFEQTLHSARQYAEPFIDVEVDAVFVAPSGRTCPMPAFYDGNGVWRVRFNPGETGLWKWHTLSRPADPGLEQAGTFEVTPRRTSGFLKSTPGKGFGLSTESGEPVFLLGDTVYNLFGLAHCGGDVEPFMRRRAAQGFNILRVRVPVSPFHPPDAHSVWQTRSTWPWGGSAQAPRFDRFNLDWFRTVDRVVQAAEAIGIGLEMIMEAWGFEFPFNDRTRFAAEWELLWLRYLIARYDAYNSVYIWTLMNEYEFYPDGDPDYTPLADRWAIRIAQWIKALSPHGHVIAVHNTRQHPTFAERFAIAPDAVDMVLFQDWGSSGANDGWLTAGIEESIRHAFAGWPGSVVLAEWGYERDPAIPITFPAFEFTDLEHNRRGAWRGAFSGVGIISGFERSWGPVMNLDEDQAGVVYLQNLRRFFTGLVPWARLRPAPELILGKYPHGHRPLALASESRDWLCAYLPAGGTVRLALPTDRGFDIEQWFDPRTGQVGCASNSRVRNTDQDGLTFEAPGGQSGPERPFDWVLVLGTSNQV